jgi:hypothetical protein
MHSAPTDTIDPLEERLSGRVRAWTDRAIVPIDAADIARRAAAASGPLGLRARLTGAHATASAVAHSQWRGRSRPMLTATRLVAAVAIVALGAGPRQHRRGGPRLTPSVVRLAGDHSGTGNARWLGGRRQARAAARLGSAAPAARPRCAPARSGARARPLRLTCGP